MSFPFVPAVVPTRNYPGQAAPYSNVTPFTDRDYRTFVGQLEGFIAWLNSDVIDHTNTTFSTIGERLNEFTNLTAEQQAAWQADTAAAIKAYKDQTGVDIGQYKGYFDTTVQSVTTLKNAATGAKTDAETARNAAQAARDETLALTATTTALQAQAVAALLGGSTSLPANAATAALVKAIRAIVATRTYNARIGFMGDSITDTGIVNPQTTGGQWWALASGLTQKYWPTVQAGKSGETTTQMLARIATNFPAGSIDVGVILGGTNDVGQNFPLATTVSNITAMVDYIRSIGAVPILATIPPRAEGAKVDAINQWVKDYGNVNNITVVDFWTILADASTRLYKTGLTSDGIHPTPAGHKLMATTFAAAVSKYLTNSPAEVVANNAADTRNALDLGFISGWQATPTVVAPTLSAGGSGSPLTAGTYYYKTAYLNYSGESQASAEVSITITDGQTITVSAPAVPGQARVVIYRSTTPGDEVFMVEVTAGGGATVYADNGSVVPSGTKTPSSVNHYSAPNGWASGLGVGSLSVTKVTNDAAFVGDAVDIEGRSGGLAQISTYKQLPVKWDIGDVIGVSFKIRSYGGQVNRAYIHLRSAALADVNVAGYVQGDTAAFSGDTLRFYQEIKTTADIYNVGVDFTTDGKRLRVGDVSIINLTKLGLR